MKPAVLPLQFELGAVGEADFTVAGLVVTAAVATFRGLNSPTPLLVEALTVVGSVLQLRLTQGDVTTIGAGISEYQLDVVIAGQTHRLAKGSVTVAYGLTTVF